MIIDLNDVVRRTDCNRGAMVDACWVSFLAVYRNSPAIAKDAARADRHPNDPVAMWAEQEVKRQEALG
jgi:hypothetical protein